MNRRDVHRQAEEATKLADQIGAVITLALVILSLMWVALRGDDIRAARLGITVHELDRLEWAEVEARIEAARAQHTNECGWGCIQRIPAGEEGWPVNQGQGDIQ